MNWQAILSYPDLLQAQTVAAYLQENGLNPVLKDQSSFQTYTHGNYSGYTSIYIHEEEWQLAIQLLTEAGHLALPAEKPTPWWKFWK
ncbi:MAG: DUF2007 domain-containing protein [Bacteroidota bacterium]